MAIFSEEMRRNPYPVYEQMRSRSPVVFVPEGDLWMILDYSGVKRALEEQDTFSSRAAASGSKPLDWLIFSDPPRHTKLRTIISRAFTPRVVANLEPHIAQLSRDLLRPALAAGSMDFAADFAAPLPLMVIMELFGMPASDWPRFKRWSDAILGLSDAVWGGEVAAQGVAKFQNATTEMIPYLSGIIEARRTMPQDDLITRLVEAEVDGSRLDGAELLGFFQLLLLAGSETTTNLLGNAILTFIENPAELARLRSAPQMLPAAIEEVLRYRSPLQAVFRQTTRAVEVHGQPIPAGKLVFAMIGSANRDANYFHEPHRFDIARDPNPHLAFGHGIHFCLGASLARLEARVALAAFLERVSDFALAEGELWLPRQAYHVHGATRLLITIQPAREASAISSK